MRRLLLPVGLACTTVLALGACGTGSGGDAGAGAGTTTEAADAADQQQKAENLLADCMKKKGFQYVPRVDAVAFGSPTDRFAGRRSLLQTDDVVRPLRQKYGFGIAAKDVYPDDPTVATPDSDPADNPNNAIRDGLDEAQRAAYDKAMGGDTKDSDGGCVVQVYGSVFGTTDLNAEQASDKLAWRQFSTDEDVVAAARKYGDCLRGKGYQITSSAPGTVELFMMEQVRPMGAAAVGEETATASGDPEAALADEIKKAVDDLDCRGGYADIVRTRYPKIVDITQGVG
ncbi:hypothetical protein [Actinoplanes sp. NPDC051851]|uniref:hypothetical protein n=1 Tax=Actinoplanes sp. NPDC051851 TaxID=3154753 RepID=UPI00343286A5